MNKITASFLSLLVRLAGAKNVEDEILKGMVFYNDGREQVIEQNMLKAQKSDGWQDKCHALSREMGQAFKCAYRSPFRGEVGEWSWEVKSFEYLSNKKLCIINRDFGIIDVEKDMDKPVLSFGSIEGKWGDLPAWKFRLVARSLMAKFLLKIEKRMGPRWWN